MPLKPALIDDLVGKVRRHCQRLNELTNEVRRNRTAAGTREVKQLETGGRTDRARRSPCC